MEDYLKIKDKILNDRNFRKQIAKDSFYWFQHIYFPHYITYDTADFQKELYGFLQDWSITFLEVIAFRGSAKSTIVSLGLPIWAMITEKANLIILCADTFPQAKDHISNLIAELENNELLINDWGPFEGKEEWTRTSVILPKYDTRITARSKGQKVRGIKHRQYRPGLIIIDDPEDLKSVRTKEIRDETYFKWFDGEVVPAGDKGTRYVLIGNLLHSDSLMSRVKKDILDKTRDGVMKEYPFFYREGEKKGKPLWAEKFRTQEEIDKEKRKVLLRTWQREYLLKIVPEEGQEILDKWIQYYDKLHEGQPSEQGTGVDLAISKKETADYTAMVSGKLFIEDGQPKVYIMPNPINERLSGHETNERAKLMSIALGGGNLTKLWVEEVAYQKRAVEEMQRLGLPAEGVKVTTDKRARLRTVAVYIQNGTVLFPKKGCEDLIIQLLGFGIEAHDDLMDGFILLVQGLMSFVVNEPTITVF